jgi:hypothetical protein
MKGEELWLQSLLPKELPNARIITYGYNANVIQDATVGRIRDFAKGLLNAVDCFRKGEVCDQWNAVGLCTNISIGKNTSYYLPVS